MAINNKVDIVDNGGRRSPYKDNPYYNPYLENSRLLTPSESAASAAAKKPPTVEYYDPRFSDDPRYGKPGRPSASGYIPPTDTGGSGGGFEDVAPGVSAKGSSSVGWGSGGSSGGGSGAVLPSGGNSGTSAVDSVQQKLREATDLANQEALNTYNAGKSELDANIENQLRELYIARMMADKALPVQMSAQGINGGATETTLAGNRNQYQSNRNSLYQDSNAKLAELLKTYNSSVNSNEQNLAQQMADLRMQLAIMEAQAKYDKELARMKN